MEMLLFGLVGCWAFGLCCHIDIHSCKAFSVEDKLNAMDNPFRLYSSFLADAVSVGILLTKPLWLVGWGFFHCGLSGIVFNRVVCRE